MRILYINRFVALTMLMLALSACGSSSTAQRAESLQTQQTVATQPTPSAQPVNVHDIPVQATNTSLVATATSTDMFYFWPTAVPSGLMISHQASMATEEGFVMELHDPSNPQNQVWIVSEPSIADGMSRGAPVNIRGQLGHLFSTGAGANVTWFEGTQWIRVGGGLLSTQDAIALAESLQPLDLETWLTRLQTSS